METVNSFVCKSVLMARVETGFPGGAVVHDGGAVDVGLDGDFLSNGIAA